MLSEEADDEKLEEIFHGRVSSAEKRRWERAAKLSQRKLSDWMRLVLRDAANQQLADHAKRKPK